MAVLVWQSLVIRQLVEAVEAATTVPPITLNDAVQKASDTLVEQSGTWAKATGLLLGVLMTLWAAKKDEPQLRLSPSNLPEIVMWSVGVLLMLAGLYCYNEYIEAIAAAFEAGGTTSKGPVSIPDLFDDKYDAVRMEQFRLLIWGAASSAFAVFSVRHLREG